MEEERDLQALKAREVPQAVGDGAGQLVVIKMIPAACGETSALHDA